MVESLASSTARPLGREHQKASWNLCLGFQKDHLCFLMETESLSQLQDPIAMGFTRDSQEYEL